MSTLVRLQLSLVEAPCAEWAERGAGRCNASEKFEQERPLEAGKITVGMAMLTRMGVFD